jgi:1-acyl-sn-glycerol-3-phosphate acyltransferase
MFAFIGILIERLTRVAMHLILDIYLFGYNRVTYHHRDRLMQTAPCILVANHSSHYDAAVLLSAFPYSQMHRVHPIAAKDYFFSSKLKGLFFRVFMNVLPIERSANMSEAFVPTEDALSRGHSIIIFPEGTRSKTGAMRNFKAGVGYLAAKFKIPVLPVYIDGAHRAFGKGSAFPKAIKITVVYGKPIYFEGNPEDREDWSAFAGSLKDEICRVGRAYSRAKDNYHLF